MENNHRSREQLRRRRWVQFGAALVALALILMTVLVLPGGEARAETRDDAVKRRDDGQAKIAALSEEVDGIDAELAAIFAAMEQTKVDVANAQIELADAEAALAASQRHLVAVQAELDAAETELSELGAEVDTSKTKEDLLTQAVGDMARDLYRGNTTSPLQVVMSSEGTAEISGRAAAASSLGRVQSRALDEVRSTLVVTENQVERQAAVTQRITELEAEAEVALAVAEDAKQQVEAKVASLETLLQEQVAAEAAWNARKAEAERQLAESDAAVAQAVKAIEQIDAENARSQLVIPNDTGGSATAPAAGKLFANPFRFSAPVTSYFGWRIHPIFGTSRLHTGTDFGAGCGTTQYATRAGVVANTGYDSGLGNYVTINHGMINGSSMVTEHGHLQSIAVSTGQSVTTGTVIGYTGTTGNSTGCHLHLNLLINGSYTSILNYM